MSQKIFTGCATALATPFHEKQIDFSAFSRLIETQNRGGVSALVIAGTTGEGSTLSEKEILHLTEFALDRTDLPIIAGCGSNDTEKAVRLAKKLSKLPIAGLLTVTPYYNKTSQEGLIHYYKRVCDSSRVPVIVYNVPQRTGCDISLPTYERICALDNIGGIKEASGQFSKIARLCSLFSGKIPLYSGSDELTLPFVVAGGDGVISVASNLFPAHMQRLCDLARQGELREGLSLSEKLSPLFDYLFSEVSPIPLKYALSRMGLCENSLREPLLPLSPEKEKGFDEIVKDLEGLTA